MKTKVSNWRLSFQSISIILFLNKYDLLALKVKNPETDIRWYYPQFTGNPHSLSDVHTFILQMFLRVRRNNSHHLQSLKPPQPIYHHFTNAVDTQNIQHVFNSVKDTILQRNLASLMLQWIRGSKKRSASVTVIYLIFNLFVSSRLFSLRWNIDEKNFSESVKSDTVWAAENTRIIDMVKWKWLKFDLIVTS